MELTLAEIGILLDALRALHESSGDVSHLQHRLHLERLTRAIVIDDLTR